MRLAFMILAFTLSVPILTVAVAPFIPLATAALARVALPPWAKLGLTTALAAISGIVTTAIDTNNDAIVTWDTLWRIALSVGLAVISYLVFRKPVIDQVADAIPGVIGPKPNV